MKRILFSLVLALLMSLGITTNSYANNDLSQQKKNFELECEILKSKNSEEEYIVKFKTGISEETKKSKLSGFSSKKIGKEKLGLYKITGRTDLDNAIKEFNVKNSNLIDYIVPNYKRKLFLAPNDDLFTNQYNMPSINIEKAWDYTTGSPNTIVAVIDTGLNLEHPDIQGKVVSGYNFVLGNTDIYDLNGHGSFVSGVIGASTNNNLGIAGVNWNSKIMPLQAIYGDGTIYDSDIIDAVFYAVDNHANVINLSFGGPDYDPALQTAIDYAISHKVTVIAAVGNDGGTVLNYPAACTGVIGVGSTDNSDIVTNFSQKNSSVDVVAPGVNLISISKDGDLYETGSGTSFSTPEVSGLAALLLSIDPSLTPSQIASILESTSKDLGAPGRDTYNGFGRIDCFEAVKMALKPIGSIDFPITNQTLSGNIDISGWFLDGSGVSKIEVLVDGVVKGEAIYGGSRGDVLNAFSAYKNGACGFSYQFNSKIVPNGTYSIAIRETSSSNIQTLLPAVTVSIINVNGIGRIDTPTNNQQLSGTVAVNGWALDDSGVSKVEVLVDGIVNGTATYAGLRYDVAAAYPSYKNNNSGFSYQLNTKGLSNGAHTITARETNSLNIQTSLHTVTVTINNLPTFGYIDKPLNNQQLSGTVTVSGWVLDDSEVSTIEVLVDGIVNGSATYGEERGDVAAAYPAYKNSKCGFSYQLNTKGLSNGAHTITVRETNSLNIQTMLPDVTVILNNLPTVGCIDIPANNQQLSGTVAITGWVLDDNEVSKVELLVDGVVKGQATYGGARGDVAAAFPSYKNSNSGFSYQLNTKGLSNGAHTITVRETNSLNIQILLPAVTVTINNLPTVGCIDTPVNNQQLSGTVTVSGWVLDNSGVSKVEVLVDGSIVGQAQYGQPRPDVAGVFPEYGVSQCGYTYQLDTKNIANGSHKITIQVTASNGSGKVEAERTVTVNNVSVTVIGSIDNPANNANVNGVVVVSGWALANGGVNKVEVLVDGNIVGQAQYGQPRPDVAGVFPEYGVSQCGYTYQLDTKNIANGSHKITIQVTASNGSGKVEAERTVTVNNNVWTTKSSMPTARYNVGAIAYNGEIYAIGGSGYDSTTSQKVEVYDIASDSWSSKATMSEIRSGSTPLLINEKIYVVGNKVSMVDGGVSTVVEEYNPLTDTWVFLSNVPTQRSEYAVATLNGKIYVIGGSYNKDMNTVEEYDPQTNQWTAKANIPTARYGLKAVALNDKILAIGGRHYDSNISLNTVEEYDPKTDQWITKASMPTPRESFGAIVVNSRVYAIGGFRLNEVEEYDPISNTWKTLANMPTARYCFGIAESGGKIFVIGGDSGDIIGTVEEFTPPVSN